MAAWLAYLKSRLLLPRPHEDDELGAEEVAAAIGHRLQLLEAMQTAGRQLMVRSRLGQDFFLRGAPEGLATVPVPVWRLELYELLRAYGDGRRRTDHRGSGSRALRVLFDGRRIAALRADFSAACPTGAHWCVFCRKSVRGDQMRRSALAATFAAVLELARDGRIELRQDRAFGPIWLRSPPALRRASELRAE